MKLFNKEFKVLEEGCNFITLGYNSICLYVTYKTTTNEIRSIEIEYDFTSLIIELIYFETTNKTIEEVLTDEIESIFINASKANLVKEIEEIFGPYSVLA